MKASASIAKKEGYQLWKLLEFDLLLLGKASGAVRIVYCE
jgi:hypothetical protein